MSFENSLPVATMMWHLVEQAHRDTLKGYRAPIGDTVYQLTSYRDQEMDSVKVTNLQSGLYTMYTRDERGTWVKEEGF